VVLSGGGASGMAHIGMLKALEENDIPIDYIAGTSMGAIIGGLYASGMSTSEMETYFLSEEFKRSIRGAIDEQYVYYFKKELDDASMVNLKIDPDTIFLRTIPSYVVSPVAMDMKILETVSSAIAIAGYDFDELMIPFRCVAADIVNKEQVVFSDGELHTALRASSSFPFYFRPLEMDGRILFDGGLYNNFPIDVMYNDFHPDVIIGCSVSANTAPPDVDDLFSQIENMILNREIEELPCSQGIIIRPQTDVGTLDFDRNAIAIAEGYNLTTSLLDSIRSLISDRTSAVEREIDRMDFVSKKKDYEIGEVNMQGVTEATERYFRKVLRLDAKKRPATLEELKPLYYRVFGDDKISYIYPHIKYNLETGKYDLNLDLQKERKIFLDFGGNFSSRPVNTGFIGLKYNLLGATPKTFYANSYFGKFYNSLLADIRLDIPGKNPYFLAITGNLQQWDYFRSFATFFQETRPSFILENERSVGLSIGRPASNKGKLLLDLKYAYEDDEYYQTEEFGATDTADVTIFEYITTGLTFERNTLNRKLYPSSGTSFSLKYRYVDGRERTSPGSTGIFDDVRRADHKFHLIKLNYENYFKTIGKLDIGLQLDGQISTQGFFGNQKASLLNAPFYQPIPESRTIFQEEFRAHEFTAVGLKLIYGISKSLDFRIENYMFQPFNEILRDENYGAVFSEDFARRFYIGSGSLVFHSPLGPLSASVNYYDQRDEPWSWIINFGYLIFNRRALD
jgi:NTE family protein